MTSKRTTFKAQGMIGRTDDGERVWIEIEIREVSGSWQTTEHEDITGYRELSITGAVAGKYRKNADAWGQVIDYVRLVESPAKGIKASDITQLVKTWQRWHLNGMKAACAHQNGKSRDCPESGYRHGSAWLVEELPADVEKWVRTFGHKLDGTQARR
jgi:hypothetical protein